MLETEATEITVTATEFKAKCLELFKRLESGRLKRITVTRRGKEVAEVAARPAIKPKTFDEIYGCMKGMMTFGPEYDPFEQVIGEPSDSLLDKKPPREPAA